MEKEAFFFSNRFELFHIELSLITFRDYYKIMEVNLQEHKNERLIKYSDKSKKLRDEKYSGKDLEYLISSVAISANELEIEFIQRFRFSIIIQLYVFLETELKKICDDYYVKNIKDSRAYKLNGKIDLQKMKTYLSNSVNIDISKSSHWVFINNFRKLRNCIVHSNGLLLVNSQNFNSIKLFSEDNFEINKFKEIYSIRIDNPEFINLCFDNIENFLVQIVNSH